eukprot:gnl/MRDRNA2_/MRDRNA2_77136_c0_seq1.p1 gnl/MRDRNA2_/MRDRNA2_77136_c0~~gnl/MRDRNA2_/MRDRNA2_77136_c0_seq1.p1  ORF type:complete len:1165 (+),score=182.33 gnl/MRDRNA2_/MRDRNA2_77136_c0_seq1:123-3497(+)
MATPLFEEFYKHYPDAKVILTTRNSSEWLMSYKAYVKEQWMYSPWRAPLFFGLSYFSRGLRLGRLLNAMGIIQSRGGLDFEKLPQLSHIYRRSDEIVFGSWHRTPTFIKTKERREEYIRSRVPKEKLLVFDATAGDNYDKLEKFLGLQSSPETTPYPNLFKAGHLYGSFQRDFLSACTVHICIAAVILACTLVLIIYNFLLPADFTLRFRVFANLLSSYKRLKSIYESRKAAGDFKYGDPAPSWKEVSSHKAMHELLALRWFPGRSNVVFKDDFKVLKTYLPTDQAVGACLAAVGLAAADLYELRGGRPQTVTVKESDAGAAVVSYLYMKVDAGEEYAGVDGFKHMWDAENTVNPVRKPYKCKDGRYIFLHGGFPKLKQGILEFFESKCDVESIAEKTMQWTAPELEKAMQAQGLAAAMCRTPAEWRDCEQFKAIEGLQVVQVEPVCGLPRARKLSSCAVTPLSDVVVIDFSHVIASPVIGRTLAEHGALVIKVVTEARPRRPCFDEETNCGKVPMEIDISSYEGKERLWALLRTADILIDGYTTGALERLGFSMEKVQAANPSLIYVDVTCYGHLGPMRSGKGFQQNANFATGTAVVEDEELMAYQMVSQLDYATGFIGAYGAILALCQRQCLGRASRVYVSLSRVATWMGLFGASLPSFPEFAMSTLRLLGGLYGHVEYTGNSRYIRPPIQMSVTPPQRCVGFRRWWRAGNVNHYGESKEEKKAMPSSDAGLFDVDSSLLSVDSSDATVSVQIRGRRDLVGTSGDHIPEMITWCPGRPDKAIPLVVKTNGSCIDSSGSMSMEAAKEVTKWIKWNLIEHGAILFRGLPLKSAHDVSKLIDMTAPDLGWIPTMIAGGGTHRSLEAPNVQTSSNEPPSCAMEPHMDKAHQSVFPESIFFCMLTELPLGAGGETIVTNMRAVTEDLRHKGVVQRFEDNGGVRYVKTFWSKEHVGINMQGFTWQKAYQTDAKAEVERVLSASGATWEWLSDDTLKVANVEPVLRLHPITNEALWVNGVHTNNASYYLHAEHIDTSQGVPMDTFFGNSEPIPEDVLAEIRGSIWHHSVPLVLRENNLLVVDNMLIGHGRMSWPDRLPRKLTLTHFARNRDTGIRSNSKGSSGGYLPRA